MGCFSGAEAAPKREKESFQKKQKTIFCFFVNRKERILKWKGRKEEQEEVGVWEEALRGKQKKRKLKGRRC